MKNTVFTILGTVAVCLAIFGIVAHSARRNAIPKETDVTLSPNTHQLEMGPAFHNVDVFSPGGRKLFTLKITDDPRTIRLQRNSEQHINVQPKP